jgi:hypothetical protein
MQNLVNKNVDIWKRPWNREVFDNTAEKDDRFVAIVIKGALSWLTKNIIIYNKPIKHFIFNTGSSYLYVESNGYEYSLSETSGEDQLYMSMPRCIVEIGNISIPTEELTQPYIRGVYEREDEDGNIVGKNAEMRRLPLDIELKCKYVLSNFNETVVLTEELINKIIFSKYFNINYLGQTVKCSIVFPTDYSFEINKIDMASSETNQKTIELTVKISTVYPQIDERTEMNNTDIIGSFGVDMNLHKNLDEHRTDNEKYKRE